MQQHVPAGVSKGVIHHFQQIQIHGHNTGTFQHALSCIAFQSIAVPQLGQVVRIRQCLEQPGFPFPIHLHHQFPQSVHHGKCQIQQEACPDNERLVAYGGNENEEQNIAAHKGKQEQ